jgi:hypothetical protein
MATGPVINPDAILGAFGRLKKALIDTSSIIYVQKAGYFDALAGTIQLYSIPEVISEFKTHAAGVTLIHPQESPSLSTDQKLIACALENELAMISEDKRILRAMGRARAPYYNALMMLNFLLFSQKIDDEGYRRYYSALENIARYSEPVWKFGKDIYTAVKFNLHSKALI